MAPDLDPGQTARLDREVVTGILLAEGGPTSHAAILARSLGIPAVVAAGRDVLDIAEGTDGADRRFHRRRWPLLPTPSASGAGHRRRRRRAGTGAGRRRTRRGAGGDRRTGPSIEVAANLGSPDEAAAAVASGADGVGLFRTEFVFLGREDPPGEEEQEAIYRAVAETLGGAAGWWCAPSTSAGTSRCRSPPSRQRRTPSSGCAGSGSG